MASLEGCPRQVLKTLDETLMGPEKAKAYSCQEGSLGQLNLSSPFICYTKQTLINRILIIQNNNRNVLIVIIQMEHTFSLPVAYLFFKYTSN